MRRVALSAEEADRLDVLIQEMLRELKKGKTVRLPGVGALRPGRQVKFEREEQKGGARGKR
jgi:nucleoid DNA-binding protein